MQTKFLVRSFLVLVILALGTVACGGTTPTAEEETATTEDAATETSGSESSDETTDTTTTPTDSNTATDDTDDDDDGVADTADNCPLAANTDQADLDADGAGDSCDDDDDGDADLDTADNCPLTANADQTDTDTDSTGDTCDDDDDGDVDLDTADNCPLVANPDQTDTDADGTGDACDEGAPPPADDTDDDDDDVADTADNCPFTANTDQADLDADTAGDSCDDDDDGDADLDTADNCPLVANADQTDTDTDSTGDACDDDDDGDDDLDTADNCPLVANPDQANLDADETGDACDADTDGDTVANDTDNCPFVANADQTDTDVDGTGDACDEDAPDETPPTAAAKSTIPAGSALSDVSTLVATATAFRLTFSEAITDDAAALQEKITLICDAGDTPAITIATADDTDEIAANEFTVTPESALPSGSVCTLTVLAGIADGLGNTITEDTSFVVTTCGLTDNFSDANSLDVCWTPGADNAGLLTASVAGGAATFSITGNTTALTEEGELEIKNVEYVKTITVDDFVLQATFSSLAGLKDSFDIMNSKADGAFLIATTVTEGEGAEPSSILCGPVGTGDGSGLRVLFLDQTTFASELSADVIGEGTGSGPLVVRLTKAGDTTFTCEYSTDGVNFTAVGTDITQAAFADPTSTNAGIFFIHTGAEELTAVVDDLSFSVE